MELDPTTVVQLVGAVLNMGAFALLHFEIAPASALRYLVPNLAGSLVLIVTAYVDHPWGFFLLEAFWVVVVSHAIYVRRLDADKPKRSRKTARIGLVMRYRSRWLPSAGGARHGSGGHRSIP